MQVWWQQLVGAVEELQGASGGATTSGSTFSYIHLQIDGLATAGQEIIDTVFPVPLGIALDRSLLVSQVAATAPATFTVEIGGVSAGTITFTGTSGAASLTTTSIPAGSRFRIVAPSPADATLADVTISLAVTR